MKNFRFIPQPAGASIYWKSRTKSLQTIILLKLSGQPSVSQKRRFLQGRGQQQRATATVVTKHILCPKSDVSQSKYTNHRSM